MTMPNLRSMIRPALATLALVAYSPAASAQAPSTASKPPAKHVATVEDLASVCDPQAEGVTRLEAIAYCQGYLTAAGQYRAGLQQIAPQAVAPLCLPSPAPTIAQVGISFAEWVRGNPDQSAQPALVGLLKWAEQTFRCALGQK